MNNQAWVLPDTPDPETAVTDLNKKTLDQVVTQINSTEKPQFTIGVFGGWGSGKTTFLRQLEKELGTNENNLVVWFSPWQYQQEQHLLGPLLAEILDRVGQKDPKMHKFVSALGQFVVSLLESTKVRAKPPGADIEIDGEKLLKAFDRTLSDRRNAFPASVYRAAYRTMKECSDGLQDKKIIILVDDLDRCSPPAVVSLLEAMKLFFDFEGYVFVLGADRKVIELIIEREYQRWTEDHGSATERIRGSDYLGKIVQLSVDLVPDRGAKGLSSDKPATVEDYIKAWTKNSTNAVNGRQLSAIIKHAEYLFSGTEINPRELKRYVNQCRLKIETSPNGQPTIGSDCALVLFERHRQWAFAREMAERYGCLFWSVLGDGREANLTRLDPRLEALAPSFLKYIADDSTGAKLVSCAKEIDPGMRPIVEDFMQIRSILDQLRKEKPGESRFVDVAQAMARLENAIERARSASSAANAAIRPLLNARLDLLQKRATHLRQAGMLWHSSEFHSWYADADAIVGDILHEIAVFLRH